MRKKPPHDDWAEITKEVHEVFDNCGFERAWIREFKSDGEDGPNEHWFLHIVGDIQISFRGNSHNWKATSIIHQCKIGKVGAKPKDCRWMHTYVEGPFYDDDVRFITSNFTQMAEEYAGSICSQEGNPPRKVAP